MKCANIQSLAFASSKNYAKGNITVKTVGICQTASRLKPAPEDTLNLAKDMFLEAADFKVNVPTVIIMITN